MAGHIGQMRRNHTLPGNHHWGPGMRWLCQWQSGRVESLQEIVNHWLNELRTQLAHSGFTTFHHVKSQSLS